MKRPNSSDYDFNNVIEAARFAINMSKYADYLELKLKKSVVDYHKFIVDELSLDIKEIWVDIYCKKLAQSK